MSLIFYEYAHWDWSKSGDHGEIMGDDDTFTVEVEYSTMIQGVPAVEAVPEGSVDQSPHDSPVSTFLSPSLAPDMVEGGGDQEEEPVLLGTPPLIHEEDLDVDQYSNVPLRVHHIDNIIGPTSPRGLARWVLDEELHAMSIEELSSFAEAEQDRC
jgi:hypothetical protein